MADNSKNVAIQVSNNPALNRKMQDIAIQLEHDGYHVTWVDGQLSYVYPNNYRYVNTLYLSAGSNRNDKQGGVKNYLVRLDGIDLL